MRKKLKSAFLPRYTRLDLTDLYQKGKDSKAKVRLLPAVFLKEGMTYETIVERKSVRLESPQTGGLLFLFKDPQSWYIFALNRQQCCIQPNRTSIRKVTECQEVIFHN